MFMKFGNGYIGYDTGLQGKTTQLTLEQHRFEHVPDHFYVDFVFFFSIVNYAVHQDLRFG